MVDSSKERVRCCSFSRQTHMNITDDFGATEEISVEIVLHVARQSRGQTATHYIRELPSGSYRRMTKQAHQSCYYAVRKLHMSAAAHLRRHPLQLPAWSYQDITGHAPHEGKFTYTGD